jgi:peptidyl-prolyl cis-trans isomerase B (cyclophilin B)
MENGNKIKVELFSDLVPTAVEYFLSYVKTGYYDGLPFHTCLKDHYVQCGYWESSGYGSPAFIEDQEEVSFEQKHKKTGGYFGVCNFEISQHGKTASLPYYLQISRYIMKG